MSSQQAFRVSMTDSIVCSFVPAYLIVTYCIPYIFDNWHSNVCFVSYNNFVYQHTRIDCNKDIEYEIDLVIISAFRNWLHPKLLLWTLGSIFMVCHFTRYLISIVKIGYWHAYYPLQPSNSPFLDRHTPYIGTSTRQYEILST